MEKTNNVNSCIMLAANLMSPVSLGCMFDSEDLKDSGVIYDSHITLLFAKSLKLDKQEVMKALNSSVAIKEVLGNMTVEEYIRGIYQKPPVPVLSLFDLSSFDNDSGYIVLKLKKDTPHFKILSSINEGLSDAFGVKSDFSTYTPHLSLAELVPGVTNKYLSDYTLGSVLSGSTINFEDLTLSHGITGQSDYSVYNLTDNNCGDRFFRIRELTREGKEL